MAAVQSVTGTWKVLQTSGLAPAPRGGAACCAVDGQFILFGGADRNTTTFDDLWVLDVGCDGDSCTWTKISTGLPSDVAIKARSGATLTAIGRQVYLFGGQDPRSGLCFNDLLVLDTDTWQWTRAEVEGRVPPGRHSHCAGGLEEEGCLVVYGGASLQGPLSDAWVYSSKQRRWTALTPGAPQPAAREMAAAVMVGGGCMFVHGGRRGDGSVLDDAWLLDVREGAWKLQAGTRFPRCAHSAGVAWVPRAVPQDAGGDGRGPQDQAGPGAGAAGGASDTVQGTSAAVIEKRVPVVVLHGGFSGQAVEAGSFAVDARSLEATKLATAAQAGGDAGSLQGRFAHCCATLATPKGENVAGSKSRQTLVVFGGVSAARDHADVIALSLGEA